jgi:hypothetical protein
MSRPHLLILITVVVASASPAFAQVALEQTVSLVEIRPERNPSALTTDYMKAVKSRFASDNPGDYILVPGLRAAEKLAERRVQVPPAITPERRRELEAAVKEGVLALDRVETQEAMKRLKATSKDLRAALAAPGSDEALADLYLHCLVKLAEAHLVAGEKSAARDALREVTTAFGLSAPVTDEKYRPDLVAIFTDLVTAERAEARGNLRIQSTPSGARAYVSGVERGKTPATVTDMLPGSYTVRVTDGRVSSMLHRVRIAAAKTTTLDIDMDTESHMVLGKADIGFVYGSVETATERVARDARKVGSEVGVNLVVAVGVVGEQLICFVVDVAAGKVLRKTTVPVPGVGVSQRGMAEVMTTIFPPKAKPGSKAKAEPREQWYHSTAGWALGGAGVVGLGVGAAFAPSWFVAKVTSEDEKEKTQRGRVIATASLLVGTALVAAAGYVFYKKRKATARTARVLGPALPPETFGHARTTFSLSAPSLR